jgi:hypothetical protein
MRKWEGRVLQVEDGIFSAELLPLREGSGPAVVADFDLELLSPDADSVQPGDTFYLTVRTVGDSVGLKTRTSTLRLKRLGSWSAEDIDRVRERARKRLAAVEAYLE